MPKRHQYPLHVEIKPSCRLRRGVLVLWALALLACMANALPVAVKLALLPIVHFGFARSARQLAAQRLMLRHDDIAGWSVSSDGAFTAVRVLPSTVITRYALFLQVEFGAETDKGGAKAAWLIAADAVGEDDYRALIIRLLTSSTAKAAV